MGFKLNKNLIKYYMVGKKYRIEFFQDVGSSNDTGGSGLNAAYKKGSSVKSLISEVAAGGTQEAPAAAVAASNSSNTTDIGEADTSSGPQGAQVGNLWQFLGIDGLSLKQKQGVYNCGIDLMGCMERCASPDCRKQENLTKEQCKYGCLRKGINCTTTSISSIEAEEQPMFSNSNSVTEPTFTLPVTTQVQTTGVSITNPVTEICQPNYEIPPTEVHGVYQGLDTHAPYDMRVWPNQGNYGWTLSELNQMRQNGYEVPDVIEVHMDHSLYPIKTDKPVMQFNYASE